MVAGIRGISALAWKTVNDFVDDHCTAMAAALSFYTFFSLPALLLLLFTMLGLLADPQEVHRELTAQIAGLVGPEGAVQVAGILEHLTAEEERPQGVTALGILTLAFGATAAFASLQYALNRIWSVEPDPDRGTIRNFLTRRVFSFGVILAVGFLMLVSLSVSTALAAVGTRLEMLLGWSETLLWAVNVVGTIAVITTLFACMFKWIPDVKVVWRDVWVGAAFTAVLFVLGKEAIGLYLGSKDPGSAYGAAGSLALLMLWVYYSSMIMLLGAELTRNWEERYGSGVRPTSGAVEVIEETRHVKKV